MSEIEVMFGRPAKTVNISHTNEGTVNKNTVTIGSDKGSVNLYFSYNTLIGVDNTISENEWGVTTGKFLNQLQPDKKKRVPHEKVLEKAKQRLKEVVC